MPMLRLEQSSQTLFSTCQLTHPAQCQGPLKKSTWSHLGFPCHCQACPRPAWIQQSDYQRSSAVTRRHSKKLDRTIMLLDVFCSKSKQEVVATAMARTVIISMTRFDSNWKRKPSTAICKIFCPVQAVHGHIIAANKLYELWWSSRNRHSKHRWVTVFFKFCFWHFSTSQHPQPYPVRLKNTQSKERWRHALQVYNKLDSTVPIYYY